MSPAGAVSVLVAEANPFKGLSGGFRPETNQQSGASVLVVLVVLVALIAALWIASRLADRRRQQGPTHSPLLLWLALCRAHRLRWSERLVLWRLARAHKLHNPARLFLEPERFSGQPPPRVSRETVAALKDQLFAGLGAQEPEARPDPPADPPHEPSEPPPFPLLATISTIPDEPSPQPIPADPVLSD